jgi:hypothetical protein
VLDLPPGIGHAIAVPAVHSAKARLGHS